MYVFRLVFFCGLLLFCDSVGGWFVQVGFGCVLLLSRCSMWLLWCSRVCSVFVFLVLYLWLKWFVLLLLWLSVRKVWVWLVSWVRCMVMFWCNGLFNGRCVLFWCVVRMFLIQLRMVLVVLCMWNRYVFVCMLCQ